MRADWPPADVWDMDMFDLSQHMGLTGGVSPRTIM